MITADDEVCKHYFSNLILLLFCFLLKQSIIARSSINGNQDWGICSRQGT